MKLKKGDTVKVIAGKDRGKTGTIKMILRKSGRVIVEGINIVKKHKKAITGQPDEAKGIIEMEAPIHASNVMLVDPKDNKTTRIGYEVKDNKKTRITKKNNTLLN